MYTRKPDDDDDTTYEKAINFNEIKLFWFFFTLISVNITRSEHSIFKTFKRPIRLLSILKGLLIWIKSTFSQYNLLQWLGRFDWLILQHLVRYKILYPQFCKIIKTKIKFILLYIYSVRKTFYTIFCSIFLRVFPRTWCKFVCLRIL